MATVNDAVTELSVMGSDMERDQRRAIEIPWGRRRKHSALSALTAKCGPLPLLLLAAACGSDPESSAASEPGPDEPGAAAVGHVTVQLSDGARNRDLTVELWYPARAEAAQPEPVQEYLVDSERASTYAQLLEAAPAGCPARFTGAARDAEPAADGPLPVVVFSHCHNCVRFSSFSVAERLASHGMVVVAPDHATNTLFDELEGNAAELGSEFLEVRAADVSFVLDRVLDPASTELPEALRGQLDPSRVGMFGHSFGAVTTGSVAAADDRVRAAAALAAPMENPLVRGASMSEIAEPVMFLVAREDNSITEIGNQFMRDNFASATARAYKVEVADAGHWSFSDITAITESFEPGCGDAQRQTVPSETFTYLPVETGRDIAASYVTAFLMGELLGDSGAIDWLLAGQPGSYVDVEQR